MRQIFHPREGLGGPRMKGNPPMAAATCPAFARRSRSTIFLPSASVVRLFALGLHSSMILTEPPSLLVDVTGGVSFGICLLQTPHARTWEVHPPLGNNALPFASPRRRVSGKVLPVSIDWCIPRGNNVSVCSMRVSYNEPLPSRQCPSLSTFMVRASPARGRWVRNQRRMHRSGHKTRGSSRGIVPRTSPSSSRRQRSGHRCHDRRHHDRRFFYPSSVRTSSLQDFVRGRAHVIHFRLGVDIRVRYF